MAAIHLAGQFSLGRIFAVVLVLAAGRIGGTGMGCAIGLVFGIEGWDMPLIAWIAAVLMIIGIFTIATNPLAFFMKKEED